jgi:hypothetical protein
MLFQPVSLSGLMAGERRVAGSAGVAWSALGLVGVRERVERFDLVGLGR